MFRLNAVKINKKISGKSTQFPIRDMVQLHHCIQHHIIISSRVVGNKSNPWDFLHCTLERYMRYAILPITFFVNNRANMSQLSHSSHNEKAHKLAFCAAFACYVQTNSSIILTRCSNSGVMGNIFHQIHRRNDGGPSDDDKVGNFSNAAASFNYTYVKYVLCTHEIHKLCRCRSRWAGNV